MAVTGNTVDFFSFYMGGMGKEYTIRLSGVYQPRNLSSFRDILLDKFDLIMTYALDLIMAVNALLKFRNSGICAVFTEEMAAFTPVFNFCHMQYMVKIDRLFFSSNKAVLGK